jgi:hypothetical protein
MCVTTGAKNQTHDNIPPWVKLWLVLYHAVPKVCIPGTRMDVSFMFASMATLCAVKFFFQYLLEQFFDWPMNSTITWDAAASLTGIFHSTNLLGPLWMLLRTQPYKPSGALSDAPQWWQDGSQALLQLTTGYMLYDLFVNIVLLRWDSSVGGPVFQTADYLFLGHHLATAFYMTSTRLLRAGHISAMCCMFLGELTNPLFNAYLVTGLAKKIPGAIPTPPSMLVNAIEIVNALLYVPMRTLISPVIFLHMTYDLLFSQTAKRIPIALRLLWVAMIWGVVIGSLPWVYDFNDTIKSYFGMPVAVKEEL